MGEDLLINLTTEEVKTKVLLAKAVLKTSDKTISRGKALEKLKNTDEYKEVFLDGYFNEYAQHIFKEMTNPKQFAIIPLEDSKDILLGIKALKAYLGFEVHHGVVEHDMQTAFKRKQEAQSTLDEIG